MVMTTSIVEQPHRRQYATANRMQSRLLCGSVEEFCNVSLLLFLASLNSGQHNGRLWPLARAASLAKTIKQRAMRMGHRAM
ncbi:MAG: hypothetical protein ABSA62_06475 [Methyloceanibacter sp.]